MDQKPEPTIEQLSMMASYIYCRSSQSPQWAVNVAIRVWDHSIKLLEERQHERKIKAEAEAARAAKTATGPVSP